MLCCYTRLRDIIDKFSKGVSGIVWLVPDIISAMCSTDVTGLDVPWQPLLERLLG